jgi:hypothetical protein
MRPWEYDRASKKKMWTKFAETVNKRAKSAKEIQEYTVHKRYRKLIEEGAACCKKSSQADRGKVDENLELIKVCQ